MMILSSSGRCLAIQALPHRPRSPDGYITPTRDFHSGEEERNSRIGKNRIEPQIAVPASGIGDVMEPDPGSPGDRAAHEILHPRPGLQHKIELGALFSNTRSQIGPEHTEADVPIRHPSSEGKEVVFEEQ